MAAYLRDLDLSGFDPKAPPPKTAAFWDIVNSGVAPETSEMADTLDRLGQPPAVTLEMIRLAFAVTPTTRPSSTGSATGGTHGRSRTGWKSAATSPSATPAPRTGTGA